MVLTNAMEAPALNSRRDYPEPILPVHPMLTRDSFAGPRQSVVTSILDAGHVVFLTSARFGIARALMLARAGSGDEVLLPAFNCPAMISPVSWSGATPLFYRIHEDLAIDVNDVRSKVTSRTKALIAVHYFGFHQRLELLQDLCKEEGIALIEDCAHCFYGDDRGAPIGSRGDYAVGSLWKFFPVFDGGCLVSKNASILERSPARGSALFQLKSAVRVLERSRAYGTLPFAPILGPLLASKEWAWSMAKDALSASRGDLAPTSTEAGYDFEPDWLYVAMSYFSRAVVRAISHERAVITRRKNFQQLVNGLSTHRGVRPIFSSLPEGVVPYMLPLYVDRPESMFGRLKLAGVPLLRWEDATIDACSVTARYARHLFLLPCHQELSADDLEWILNRIESAVAPLATEKAPS
jgi:hypothetical protein